ncbi:MAG: GIY-YIG nuclease family protein [Oscillospiraceae bacterium]|nr:GIY-YIG nuclease family protein [Oscillospiraceae bacterium]
MNYTYMLECADGTLYTGWTNDLAKRLKTHNAGRGGRYTRSRLPVKLVYAEEHEQRSDAMRREVQLKQLSRAEKLKLIQNKQNCISAQD